MVALVLDAGGARSAYQVGALEVLLPAVAERGTRPRVLVGTSAGALLTAALGATAHLEPDEQTTRLDNVLSHTTKQNVMRPLWRQVPDVVVRYASETLGLSHFRLRGLFGSQPLAQTLATHIDWDALHRNVTDGVIGSVAVTATSVRTGRVTMFTESGSPVPRSAPEYHGRFVAARLDVPHLMASAAIPVLFPSVHVDEPAEAAGWFVDGATRRRAPLAPALELGADRVVVVGTGGLRPPAAEPDLDRVAVDLGDAGATLLGAVMDDPLRHDLRRLTDLNGLTGDAELAPILERHRAARGRDAYRTVPYVAVAPEDGEELARTAIQVFRANHGSLMRTLGDPDLQIVHRLLGSDSPLQGELLSYLLFDPDFFAAAAAFGRRDALRWVEQNPDLWRTDALPDP
ncbi:patatin-like phospholipase family protein [Nocardioides euryhalodurans]|uniref:patatin-like phospholipase family protein n=1 Tax=Nocardioides euryhalodurans TaxID=2518370 RepID=UPI00141DCA33|nr:patatin-like phospholipase family protein [Nocardioides euryhalodurans]